MIATTPTHVRVEQRSREVTGITDIIGFRRMFSSGEAVYREKLPHVALFVMSESKPRCKALCPREGCVKNQQPAVHSKAPTPDWTTSDVGNRSHSGGTRTKIGRGGSTIGRE